MHLNRSYIAEPKPILERIAVVRKGSRDFIKVFIGFSDGFRANSKGAGLRFGFRLS